MTENLSMLYNCLKELKDISREQGNQIVRTDTQVQAIVKTMDDIHDDFKEIFTKLDGQNVRLSGVEIWQSNFDKGQNRKIALMGGLIGAINIIVSVILVLGMK